jgi:hypothetical protein
MGTEVLDNVESWNFHKYIPALAHEPRHDFFKTFDAEVEDFSRVSICDTVRKRMDQLTQRPSDLLLLRRRSSHFLP